MAQQNPIIPAKQGDIQAIAYLINRALDPQGIKARVALNNGLLQVILESDPLPNQELLAPRICKGVSDLNVESVQNLRVYGRKTGENNPSWSKDFKIVESPEVIDNPISSQESEESETSIGLKGEYEVIKLSLFTRILIGFTGVIIGGFLLWVQILPYIPSSGRSYESASSSDSSSSPSASQSPSPVDQPVSTLDKLAPLCQESRSSLTSMTQDTQQILANRGYYATSDEILEGVYASVSPYTEPQVCASVFYLIATLVGK